MLNLFPLRRETCGSTKRTSIRFANDKKVAPFCAIVLAANCETFREPSYPTTARRTIGTHNWMRKKKASTNRLRFRTGLEESTSKTKRGRFMKMSRILKVMVVALVVTALGIAASGSFAQSGSHTSSQFQGPKANKGTVTHSTKDGKSVLTLSDDFVVPDTPDPHWQASGTG